MLADQLVEHPVLNSRTVFQGKIFDIVGDTVDLGHGDPVYREYVNAPGAVAIVALDDAGRVALVNQYRHPIGYELWEIPAGLLDVSGESALAGAQRELAEEADLTAATWHVLVDFLTSPGGTNEALRIYLARDLAPTPEKFDRSEEEADMRVEWLPLDDLVAAILAGRIQNPSAVVGALATKAARDANWAPLRDAHSPWPHRPQIRP